MRISDWSSDVCSSDLLQTYGYHGLFEEERSLGQKFIFDIEAELQPVETHRDDRLDSSVRYDAVADTVVQLAGAAQYQTLETLAEAVAIGLLEQFAAIDTIAVAVSKFSPPVAHDRKSTRLNSSH